MVLLKDLLQNEIDIPTLPFRLVPIENLFTLYISEHN